ncbi:hypothetical protein COEX109129_26335 [Corallococcus exiguus]
MGTTRARLRAATWSNVARSVGSDIASTSVFPLSLSCTGKTPFCSASPTSTRASAAASFVRLPSCTRGIPRPWQMAWVMVSSDASPRSAMTRDTRPPHWSSEASALRSCNSSMTRALTRMSAMRFREGGAMGWGF